VAGRLPIRRPVIFVGEGRHELHEGIKDDGALTISASWLRRSDWLTRGFLEAGFATTTLRRGRRLHHQAHPTIGGSIHSARRRDATGRTRVVFVFLAEAQSLRKVGFESHFRPLVERKTDITVFEQLLTPAKPKQLVDV
jgi:hypothetical protein